MGKYVNMQSLFIDGVSRHRSPLVGKYACNVRPASWCVGWGESWASEIFHVGCRQHQQHQVQPSWGMIVTSWSISCFTICYIIPLLTHVSSDMNIILQSLH